MPELYVGLMSGTSLDGIDCVVASFDDGVQLRGAHAFPLDTNLNETLRALNHGGNDEIARMCSADRRFAEVSAAAVLETLARESLKPRDIRAIGSHGQTLRHQPVAKNDWARYTLQIGDPNTIAELTGICTVADFRRRDLAAGGQGAPLVPAFHRFAFDAGSKSSCTVNIGGIANIAQLDDPCLGFDCGPGNVLMNAWAKQSYALDFDDRGKIAHSGQCQTELLNALLATEYLSWQPPKSTGRELFDTHFLEAFEPLTRDLPGEDVMATLCEFTARSVCDAVARWTPCQRLIICGGGARNDFLMERIRTLSSASVSSSEAFGLHPDWVEATAFAWLARQTLHGEPGNVHSATGARGERILGGIYQA